MLTFSAFACQHETEVMPRITEEFVSARKNDVAWNGLPEIHLNSATDTLTFLAIANQPNDEVLFMKLRFDGAGVYELTGNQAYYYTTVGGDVLTSEYKLVSGVAGILYVENYNAAEHLLEGSFRLTLAKERSNPENDTPTLHFTDGSFRGYITD